MSLKGFPENKQNKILTCRLFSLPRPRLPVQRLRHLEESLFLLQVFADHRRDVVRLAVGPQLVGAAAPVFFPLVLLLQAFQHAAHLSQRSHGATSRNSTRSCSGITLLHSKPAIDCFDSGLILCESEVIRRNCCTGVRDERSRPQN